MQPTDFNSLDIEEYNDKVNIFYKHWLKTRVFQGACESPV